MKIWGKCFELIIVLFFLFLESKYTKKECGIQGDGNCLFAAVLQQVHSVPPDHTASDLRKQMLAEMAKI